MTENRAAIVALHRAGKSTPILRRHFQLGDRLSGKH